MKPRFPSLLLAVVLFAGAAHADPADEIRRLNGEISVATWSGDAVWFEENLADEYVLITPGGAVRTKREVIRELSTPGLRMEPYEPEEVMVRLYGDAAVVTGRKRQIFTLGGMHHKHDLRYTDVYVRRKSRWMLVSGHTSLITAGR